ncbi:GHMP kinase, partial [bacterium]|nr:GHMP kinase [bacterium]
MIIHTKAHARAGLLGNPSDGFYGKTISFIIRNFAARVTLYESPGLEIHHESAEDRSQFRSVGDLVEQVNLYGYYGGIRLIKAAIKKFVENVSARGFTLAPRNFTIRYRSNIPRLVGMGGSSAIVTATVRALMSFYDIDIPQTDIPSIVLAAEAEELEIPAGLQDRVIQTYEGLVYMDFDQRRLEECGHGAYEPIPKKQLQNIFVAYRAELAEGSEVVHSGLRTRFHRKERAVVQAMKTWAAYAEQGREALAAGDLKALGRLMDANFDLRNAICPLNPRQVEMVEAARSLGAACKFAGSGGTVVGVYHSERQYAALQEAYA